MLDLQHLSKRQKAHVASLGTPTSILRETVLCVLDISPPSPLHPAFPSSGIFSRDLSELHAVSCQLCTSVTWIAQMLETLR